MGSRILVCAYACVVDPAVRFPGGGDLMAWSLVKRLGRAHRLWVLTAAQNRDALEVALKKEPLPSVEFHYVDLPGWLHPLLRHQGGLQFYAYLWQWKAYLVARKLHQRVHFHAFHHLSYTTMTGWRVLSAPCCPFLTFEVQAGEHTGRRRRSFGTTPSANVCWEQVRTIGQWLYRHDPFFVLGRRRAKAILVCNREALNAVPRKWQHKVQLFPLNGVPSAAFDGFTPEASA